MNDFLFLQKLLYIYIFSIADLKGGYPLILFGVHVLIKQAYLLSALCCMSIRLT